MRTFKNNHHELKQKYGELDLRLTKKEKQRKGKKNVVCII